MQFDIWSLILIVAIFNGFLFGAVQIVKGLLAKRFNALALALIILAYCQLQYWLGYQGYYEFVPHLIYVEAPLWFLVGPLILVHVKGSILVKDLLHLLPALIMLGFVMPFYFLPAEMKLEYFLKQSDPDSYEPNLLQYIYLLHLSIYVYLGFREMVAKDRIISKVTSNAALLNNFNLKLTLAGLGGYCLLAFCLSFLMDYSYSYWAPFDFINFLLLSIMLIVVSLTPSWYMNVPKNLEKISSADITRLKEIMEIVDEKVNADRLYTNPELKISDVAELVRIPIHQISAAINQVRSQNFFEYINTYRINAVKENMANPEYRNFTLMAIANEFGFNSNTSFHRIFRKYTGKTPKAYLKSLEA
ncbi:MAG: helix-turn-helix domain-containing protein [Cyclobacteriaceae bacterium]